MKESVSRDSRALATWSGFSRKRLPGKGRFSVEMAAVSGRRGVSAHTYLLPGGDMALNVLRKMPKDVWEQL